MRRVTADEATAIRNDGDGALYRVDRTARSPSGVDAWREAVCKFRSQLRLRLRLPPATPRSKVRAPRNVKNANAVIKTGRVRQVEADEQPGPHVQNCKEDGQNDGAAGLRCQVLEVGQPGWRSRR
jgi:hypothetical protein